MAEVLEAAVSAEDQNTASQVVVDVGVTKAAASAFEKLKKTWAWDLA
jgi:hypothetical protein